jgi:hypothetical protein
MYKNSWKEVTKFGLILKRPVAKLMCPLLAVFVRLRRYISGHILYKTHVSA